MSKKWYAKIKADDKSDGKIIKIGVVKNFDSEGEKFFFVITDYNEENHAKERNLVNATQDIFTMWGRWNSFEWMEWNNGFIDHNRRRI